MANELTFDKENHHYFIDGVRVPCVSDAVELLCGEFFNTNHQRTQDGDDIHLICNVEDAGELIDENIPDEFYGYLRSWRKFKKANERIDIDTSLIEMKYNSKYGYAGTPDRVCCLTDGARFRIIDIKTGIKVFDRHQYQLIGYCQLVAENLNINHDQIELQAVYLRPDDYEFQIYKWNHELWQDFYSAVRVLNRRMK